MSGKTEHKTYYEKVYEVVAAIPRGRVTNYGAIADYLSLGSSRMVGWALNQCHGAVDVPAHRVVNRIGELSGRLMFATPTLMQERLESEGVKIKDHKVVDFKNIFWHPSELASAPSVQKTNDQHDKEFTAHSLLDLDDIARKILLYARNSAQKTLAFIGDLGAGKTTLIKAMAKQSGIAETSSPTFSLVNEYRGADNHTIYHMDLYRLETIEEALDMGIEEYLDSGNMIWIEWPQIIYPLLDEYMEVKILRIGDGSRKINVSIIS